MDPVGAGVEYAFTNVLTARVEYRYTNFDLGGNASATLPSQAATTRWTSIRSAPACRAKF